MDPAVSMDETPHTLRAPCPHCGGTDGVLITKSGQDTVRCRPCDIFLYCAPKTETGKAPRTVATIRTLRPSDRFRILERDQFRCVCGKHGSAETVLHVAHIVSLADGLEHGLDAQLLNSDENLVTLCEECNLGLGRRSLRARSILRALLVIHGTRQETE
jgi:5-methylcytosine-specific restriction endonuclease McrA